MPVSYTHLDVYKRQWHGFVLAGSILHFFAILFYVIPLAAPDYSAQAG